MVIPLTARVGLVIGAVLMPAAIAFGQSFPSRVIRIVTSEPGGGSDLAARVIAQKLTATLGHSVIVENRGGGVVAGEVVSRAAPDGYTLLFYGNTLWLLPLMRSHVPYDPAKDFSPVAAAISQFNILVVHPSLPVKSVNDLIRLAQSRPASLNYGSGAAGGSNHLAAELFKSMSAVDIVRIPFKSAGPAINALVAGEIHVMFTSVSATRQHVASGRVRALAITAPRPSPIAPGLPTVAASGLPGYETAQVAGALAPANTPKAVIERLNQEIVKVLERGDVKETFAVAGIETIGGSPDQFASIISAEVGKMTKLIAAAGIRDQ